MTTARSIGPASGRVKHVVALLATVTFAAVGYPVSLHAAPEPEEVTYAVEGFENYAPGMWCGRPEVRGQRIRPG